MAAGAAGSRSVLVLPPHCGGSRHLSYIVCLCSQCYLPELERGPDWGDVILEQFLALVTS